MRLRTGGQAAWAGRLQDVAEYGGMGASSGAEELERLLSKPPNRRTYSAGQVILYGGEPGMGLLVRGWAKSYANTWHSGQMLNQVHGRGELVCDAVGQPGRGPNGAPVGKNELRVVAGEAPLTTVSWLQPAGLPGLGRDVSQAIALVDLLQRRYAAEQRRLVNSQLSLTAKVAIVLIDLIGKIGQQDGGSIVLRGLTQDEISDLACASRGGVEATLRKLRRQQIIETGYRRQQILQPHKLLELSHGAWRGPGLPAGPANQAKQHQKAETGD